MSVGLVLAASILAIAAAVRSTWSPCGLSMLATMTPLAEQGRGHRYRTTAAWFVAGSVLGGASLGLIVAGLASAVGALGASSTQLGTVAVIAGALTVAADARIGGFRLPVHRRQVNERWLDQFRPWVYGAGFGWQIGCGLATYIKTCAVYLTIVLLALTGSPTAAVLVCTLFGFVRGLAVLLGRDITSPEALADFHRRFMAADRYALAAIILCEGAATVVLSTLISPWLGALIAGVCSLLLVAWSVQQRRSVVARTDTTDPVTIG